MSNKTLASICAKHGFPDPVVDAMKKIPTVEVNELTGGISLSAGGTQHQLMPGRMGQKFNVPVIEKFSTAADWVVANSGAAVWSAKAGGGVFGPNAMNFVAPAGSGLNATITQDQTINMSAQSGFWLIARHNWRKTSAGDGLSIYLSHLSNLAAGSGRYMATAYPAGRGVSVQPFWVPVSGFTVVDGTPSFTNPFLSWRFRFDTNTEASDVDFLGVTFSKQRPAVVISFDDGWDTSYSVGHVQARKREIPLSHYLISNLLDRNDIGYITTAQAREMASTGDYLGLHGDSPWDVSLAKILTDKSGLIAKLGDISTFEHAAYPEGKTGDGTDWVNMFSVLSANGVKSARLAGITGSPTLAGYGDPLALTSYPLNNTSSLAQAKAAVDTAIASGGTVHLYAHKISATADNLTWTTSDYTALLDYIAAYRDSGALDCKTIKQWYDEAL